MRILVITLAALLTACASSPPVPTDVPLEGTTWEVVEVRGITPPGSAGDDPFILIQSGIGELVGNTGCNSFDGPYRASGNELVMGPFASTRRACPPDLGDFETILLDALGSTRFYVIQLNELFLYDGPEAHVRLRRDDG